jgi:hypothetical protein
MAYEPKVGDWYTGGTGASGYYRWNGTNWQWNGRSKPSGTAVDAVTKEPLGTSSGSAQNLGTLAIPSPKVNAKQDADKALRYPSNRPINGDSDYVVFEFFDYKPPFKGGKSTGTGTPSYKTYNGSVDNLNPATGFSSILLYMPEDIQSQFGQKWGGAAFGSVAAGLLQGTAGEIKLDTALDSLNGVVKAKVFDTLRQGINKIAGASITENQILGGVTGTILNPNTEMMYDGPELRTFELNFKMVPTNNTEAQSIRKICNTFKKAMLPSFGGDAGSFGGSSDGSGLGGGNLLTVPKICRVTFMNGSSIHPYLPQYKACALANVAINFTPDGSYATYSDGAPVATQLKLSFKEMKNIFASEITLDGPSY